jgi:AcrR family transcriptional regulator
MKTQSHSLGLTRQTGASYGERPVCRLRSGAVATSRDATARPSARDRILDTAYELFARHGIQAIGVDEIIRQAGVAKATFYNHFPSKDALVLEFLNLREERWTKAWIDAEARHRADTPEEQLLTIFDLFDEWFHREDFEADSFVNVLLELGPTHPAGKASIEHIGNVRAIITQLAEEAGLRATESFTRSWHILMKGSIVCAAAGDTEAGKRAQAMAKLLIEQHR